MPIVKAINGHTGAVPVQRYLERNNRAIGHDFLNLSIDTRDALMQAAFDTPSFDWSHEMDELRSFYGNDRPRGNKSALTFRHYVISTDPNDKIDLERLRELTLKWISKHFEDYQVAIVYHNDNESAIPHAHVVVNNTDLRTGKRLHIPQPKELNRSLQNMAQEMNLRYFDNTSSWETGYSSKRRGSSTATSQNRYRTKAERRIEKEGGYSWIADMRSRVDVARGIARNQDEFRALLGTMGVTAYCT